MKLFIPVVLIIVVVFLGMSVIFTQGMYSSIPGESNQTINASQISPEEESYDMYLVQYAWQVFIIFIALAAVIGVVLWLVINSI